MDKRKTRTIKMGKLDHNNERAQNTPHNEHKKNKPMAQKSLRGVSQFVD
jgi:hypothetical protein